MIVCIKKIHKPKYPVANYFNTYMKITISINNKFIRAPYTKLDITKNRLQIPRINLTNSEITHRCLFHSYEIAIMTKIKDAKRPTLTRQNKNRKTRKNGMHSIVWKLTLPAENKPKKKKTTQKLRFKFKHCHLIPKSPQYVMRPHCYELLKIGKMRKRIGVIRRAFVRGQKEASTIFRKFNRVFPTGAINDAPLYGEDRIFRMRFFLDDRNRESYVK